MNNSISRRIVMKSIKVCICLIVVCLFTIPQTGCIPDKDGCVNVCWLDSDAYMYHNKAEVVKTTISDSFGLNFSSDPKDKSKWERIAEGYIKQFAYDKGKLYIEFYDKWLVFNVDDYKAGSFDYIIVDEAQDFSRSDIEIFRSHARKALLLYGDSAQQLYKFNPEKEPLSMEEIQILTRYPMEQLVFNHRLPKKIARVAQYINAEGDELEERCTEEGTEKPKVLCYPSREAELDAAPST